MSKTQLSNKDVVKAIAGAKVDFEAFKERAGASTEDLNTFMNEFVADMMERKVSLDEAYVIGFVMADVGESNMRSGFTLSDEFAALIKEALPELFN